MRQTVTCVAIAEAPMSAVAMTKSPLAAVPKALYKVGDIPPLGHVPALESGRRGHRPLQSGRRRRRGMQRWRSAAVAVAAHLGLRDPRWFVRAILPRAVAPADDQARTSDLGGGGLLHAHARHRLP